MTLYIDLIFLINIWFDFLLLTTTALLLKRNIKFKRIILGSLVGGITIFVLFLKLNNILLFLFKIVVSILMILVTFSYKNLKYTLSNLGYFYLTSIILGGGMYLLSNSFSYSSQGLLLYKSDSLSYIVLLFLSPLIIIFYIKETNKLNNNYSNYHKVDIVYKKKVYHLNGYLDTGNNLYDPYKKRGIILVNIKLNYDIKNIIYTPFETLNNKSVLKCLKPDSIFVDNKEFKNYLIGIANDKFQIDGINCILHNKMKGYLK